MPLVEHKPLPAFERLRQRGEKVLSLDQAVGQDIRELHVGLLNMMPDAALVATEIQFMRLVGSCNQIAQFFVHPFTVDGLPRSQATQDYIDSYYQTFDGIKEAGLDALIIEFNHDLELLANGAYPATLKSRIGGPYGHLSNPDTVALLRRLDCSRLRVLIAAHLSEKTNAPDIVEACFSELAFQDTECMLAAQDQAMPWIELSSPPAVDAVHATDGA